MERVTELLHKVTENCSADLEKLLKEPQSLIEDLLTIAEEAGFEVGSDTLAPYSK